MTQKGKPAEFGQEESWPVSNSWSLDQLLQMNREDVLGLWRTLPEVSIEELQGHFMGFAPNRGDHERQARVKSNLFDENSRLGFWLGKAFLKTGPNEGEGYNRCRFPGGKVKNIGRYTTEIAPSLIDGNPSFMLYYGSYHANAPSFMDEIRKLDEYVYLGIGSTLDENGTRDLDHFILLGPTDTWVGGAPGELVPDWVKPTK